MKTQTKANFKFSTFFAMLLILPMMLFFVACGEKNELDTKATLNTSGNYDTTSSEAELETYANNKDTDTDTISQSYKMSMDITTKTSITVNETTVSVEAVETLVMLYKETQTLDENNNVTNTKDEISLKMVTTGTVNQEEQEETVLAYYVIETPASGTATATLYISTTQNGQTTKYKITEQADMSGFDQIMSYIEIADNFKIDKFLEAEDFAFIKEIKVDKNDTTTKFRIEIDDDVLSAQLNGVTGTETQADATTEETADPTYLYYVFENNQLIGFKIENCTMDFDINDLSMNITFDAIMQTYTGDISFDTNGY